jgi:ABC-type maltose transport system permease subunit
MAASDPPTPDSPYGAGAAEEKLERDLERVARSGYQPAAKARYFRFSRKEKVVYPPMRFGKWLRVLGWRYAIAMLVVLFALYPVVWMVSASINPVDTLSSAELIPEGATFDNYREIIDNPEASPFMTWLLNTWKISLIVAALNIILAAMAGYAFSRFRFKGRRLGLLSLLLVQVFPQYLTFVAIFLILDQIGEVFPAIGLDTHAGLMLVYLGGAIGFNAFLIKGFMDSIPISLDESARVDGASPSVIFWRIILPLTRPILAVLFVITFIITFGEFILARTLLSSIGQLTYAVGLQTFTRTDYAAKWGQLAAGAVIGALPIVVTFLVFQRQIVGGLTQGAVKG